ncbi:MAG: hypothetical protein ABID54_00715 [Pseudomonadota bacterium]
MISKEALDKFKVIWKEEFGEEISNEKALDSATSLLTLMNAVYKHINKDEYDKYQEENRIDKAYDILFTETEKRNSGKRGGVKYS